MLEDVQNKNMEDVCLVMVETHPYSTVQQRAAKRKPNEGDAGYDTELDISPTRDMSALLKGVRCSLFNEAALNNQQ